MRPRRLIASIAVLCIFGVTGTLAAIRLRSVTLDINVGSANSDTTEVKINLPPADDPNGDDFVGTLKNTSTKAMDDLTFKVEKQSADATGDLPGLHTVTINGGTPISMGEGVGPVKVTFPSIASGGSVPYALEMAEPPTTQPAYKIILQPSLTSSGKEYDMNCAWLDATTHANSAATDIRVDRRVNHNFHCVVKNADASGKIKMIDIGFVTNDPTPTLLGVSCKSYNSEQAAGTVALDSDNRSAAITHLSLAQNAGVDIFMDLDVVPSRTTVINISVTY